jgi:phenylacetate-CoA ligase
MWKWAGFELGAPYLAMNLNPRDAWRKRLQDVSFRCTYLTYNADTVNSARIIDLLSERKIVHINAFGSTLIALADYMTTHQIENPGVSVLTSTGDNLFRPQRDVIEGAFGVGVTDYYGAGGEGVHLASQCELRDRYHIHMENTVLEILKEGRPARPGELGNIVVTQLDNYAMPLIRYDMGDLAKAGDDRPCPCGRAHPTIQSINGRACDVIRTPSGSALLPQFFFIGSFKTLEKVARYQVVQEQIERISIKLVAEPGCDQRASEMSLRGYLDAATGGSLAVDFEWVPEIPLAGLGKPRTVVSKLSLAGSTPSVPPSEPS